MQKISKDIDYISVRSFLMSNVDNLLETITAIRKDKQNPSDDLFAMDAQSNQVSVPWKTDYTKLSPFEILMQEKNSLGIYVSGNPLNIYKDFLGYLQFITGVRDLHLVLIEKVRKIFTRSNKMMLALELTTLNGSVEGIIFPKKAPKLSPLVEELELFFVIGKYSEKKKKDSADDGGKSYDDTPKLLVRELSLYL